MHDNTRGIQLPNKIVTTLSQCEPITTHSGRLAVGTERGTHATGHTVTLSHTADTRTHTMLLFNCDCARRTSK